MDVVVETIDNITDSLEMAQLGISLVHGSFSGWFSQLGCIS